MAKSRTLFYGWFEPRTQTFRISRLPPDAPVRPSVGFGTAEEVIELVDRKHADIMWLPPLTRDQMPKRQERLPS